MLGVRSIKQGLWRGLFVLLFLDSLLVGWLVFSADTLIDFVVGSVVSVVVPLALFGVIALLEVLDDRSGGDVGRHNKKSR